MVGWSDGRMTYNMTPSRGSSASSAGRVAAGAEGDKMASN